MNNQIMCPVCESGHLHLNKYSELVSYKNHQELLDGFSRLNCDVCGASVANATASRDNKRLVMAFHKKVDGLLCGQEVRSIRDRLSLTQAQAAKIFGGGPVAFSKYENDEVAQSEAMDKLLRLAMRSPEAVIQLAALADIEIEYVSDVEINKKERSPSGLSYLFDKFNASPLKYAPKFVHLKTKNIDMNMNEENYYEAQPITG